MKRYYLLLLLIFIWIHVRAQEPNHESDRLERAKQAIDEKDNGKAFLLLNSWLVDHPKDMEAYWYRALLLEEFEQFETALRDYNFLLEMDPHRGETLLARGRVRYRLGEFEKAKEDLKAFNTAPEEETTQIIYRKLTTGEEISQIFRDPTGNPAQAFYHLGLCNVALEENEEAISYLDSAIFHSPREADFYVGKGKAYFQLGDLDSAQKQYEKALNLNPDHFLAKQGIDILSQNTNETVLEKLTRAITEFPENPDTFKQRGYFRLMNFDPEGAIEDFDQVLFLDPGDIESMYYRGKAHARLKNWGKAETDYTNSMEIGGPNAEVFLARGQARYLSQQVEAALADFTNTIIHDPKNPSGYYHRGITHHRMGNLAEACVDLWRGKELGMEEAAIAWAKVCKKNN